MGMIHLYRAPGLSDGRREALLETARRATGVTIHRLDTEYCFNIEVSEPLDDRDSRVLAWLLAETFDGGGFGPSSSLDPATGVLVEVGPRLSFTTAWSTNAVAICRACGLALVRRIERSRRFLLVTTETLPDGGLERFISAVHDRMTECAYPELLTSFATGVRPEPVFEVPVLEEGRAALERINRDLGLAFDDWDLDYYTNLFADRIGRNPTNVECFDVAQSNSEHSRHWFFKGRLVIDGQPAPNHLIAMIREPLEADLNNSVIAFEDNSSAIRGHVVRTLHPELPGRPSPMVTATLDEHVIFTAETHNFPSGVAPFPGAETGTGGRLRDTHATGRGSLFTAGTAAYCVGNLRIPGDPMPWEDLAFQYPGNLASPLEIEIEASNGASDYGNKFGEPVVQGFTRSFGLRLPGGERREWIKPIMFSGGIGRMDARHTRKEPPRPGMWVVKVGGPAYRIGMGGGAASSMVQGENVAELDFNAVQRGDAEMEQKLNRVIRACSELGPDNPIVSIHDQGAGGNCNVLKEIVEPEGARIEVRDIPVGDETLSVLEIWGAEYQENDALLLRDGNSEAFRELCDREKVPVAFVGRVTGDGRVVVWDAADGSTPVDLNLADVLGDMPQKTFELDRIRRVREPLVLPPGLTVRAALDRVLRLLSVGSKTIPHHQGGPRGDRAGGAPTVRRPAPADGGRRGGHRPQPPRDHRCGHRHRRAAVEGPPRPAGDGPADHRRGPHQPGLGEGQRTPGHPVLRQLDVGRQAARGGRRPVRRGRSHARPHARARHRGGRGQGLDLDGGPGARRRDGEGAGFAGAFSVRHMPRHHRDDHPGPRASRPRAAGPGGPRRRPPPTGGVGAGPGIRTARRPAPGPGRTEPARPRLRRSAVPDRHRPGHRRPRPFGRWPDHHPARDGLRGQLRPRCRRPHRRRRQRSSGGAVLRGARSGDGGRPGRPRRGHGDPGRQRRPLRSDRPHRGRHPDPDPGRRQPGAGRRRPEPARPVGGHQLSARPAAGRSGPRGAGGGRPSPTHFATLRPWLYAAGNRPGDRPGR